MQEKEWQQWEMQGLMERVPRGIERQLVPEHPTPTSSVTTTTTTLSLLLSKGEREGERDYTLRITSFRSITIHCMCVYVCIYIR